MTASDDEVARRGRAAFREFRELERVFDELRDDITKKLFNTQVGDPAVLTLHAEGAALRSVRRKLFMLAEHGVVAERALELEETRGGSQV